MPNNRFYFHVNGNYGEMRNMDVFDVSHFTADDWQDIESCPNKTRYELAEHIYLGHELSIGNAPVRLWEVLGHLNNLVHSLDNLLQAIEDDVSDEIRDNVLTANIATKYIVEGLALKRQLRCRHEKVQKRFSKLNKTVFYECVNCGSVRLTN